MRKSLYTTLMAATVLSTAAFGGNPQRAGSAGASELLINPWAGSAGLANSNVASVMGLEGSFMNIAGLAHNEGTEVGFANTQWLVGSGISVNAAGIAQQVGENGNLALSIQSFDYGEWDITTEDQPEGGAGTISPTSIVIGLGYAQRFTTNIYGGVNIKVYNSTISNLSATGIAVDAGVQYITETKKNERNVRLGITLKNVGPSFSYGGDGLSINLPVPQGGYSQAFNSRSADFELPTQLTLGGAYDWNIAKNIHRLTINAAFVANSFEKDNYVFGLEYGFKKWLAVRAGYRVNDNRVDGRNTTALSGPSAGVMFNAPMGKANFRFDYAYRAAQNFSGIHTIGVAVAF
ncbi:MAG: PorV/PorQ family protein [Bacteroidetes bacterium]|uniref:Conjugal transfer protein TraF n=1 Tax=Phaeocystidibacter marisrubri TaxID=1577780 RepID=A0A6L3ZF15_9FLAO|nr:PorV/PorQ family protein [Phaeocystidibacter marisrubri]KAB2816074.1 conjugal transfer protein TraF [Phaeocystidibacter marisrubri]TNE30647.1 MAG: PorV/PorQ family protein [Bacteroidota bacterium]